MTKIATRRELGLLFRMKKAQKKLTVKALLQMLEQKRVYIPYSNLSSYLHGTGLPVSPEPFAALCQVLDVDQATLDLRSLIPPRFHRAYGIPEAAPSMDGGLPVVSSSSTASLSTYPGFSIQNGDNIVGASAAMLLLFSQLKKVVNNPNQDAIVLVTGETGTGKELIAKAIHYNGARKDKLFVGLNITNVSETLLESELFGHSKGAFTDAMTDKIGFLESVDGGTILLDEIGSLPSAAQAKLLRVLEEKSYYRVGDTELRPFAGRILAATKEDLEKKVREGSFREDLWYRLDVVRLHVPPLRERKEDIPLLFQYFVDCYNAQYGTAYSSEMAAGDKEALQEYGFPGNVREFKHLLTRAIFAEPEEKSIHLAPHLMSERRTYLDKLGIPTAEIASSEPRERFVAEIVARTNGELSAWQRTRLTNLLHGYYDAQGDSKQAAELAGISLRSFYRTLQLSAMNTGTIKGIYRAIQIQQAL